RIEERTPKPTGCNPWASCVTAHRSPPQPGRGPHDGLGQARGLSGGKLSRTITLRGKHVECQGTQSWIGARVSLATATGPCYPGRRKMPRPTGQHNHQFGQQLCRVLPMDFSLQCACGKRVVVTEGMAGTAVSCTCGHLLTVPTLGEMRKWSANRDPDEVAPS